MKMTPTMKAISKMKISSKTKMTSKTPNPPNLHACSWHGLPSRGSVFGLFLVCFLPFLVRFWSVFGQFLVRFWSVFGPFWSVFGPFLVRFLSIFGTFLVRFYVRFWSAFGLLQNVWNFNHSCLRWSWVILVSWSISSALESRSGFWTILWLPSSILPLTSSCGIWELELVALNGAAWTWLQLPCCCWVW